MSQIEKLIEKLKNTQGECRLIDLARFLEHMGYTKVRQRGSHVHYRKSDLVPVSFSTHGGMVKGIYVKEILKGLNI